MVLNYRMRFYIGLFFCFGCFFISCGNPGDVPDNMLTMPQMAEVLTDMHIVDASMVNVMPVPDTLTKHGLALYLQVFKIHHIDSAQFRANLKYYTAHPDVLFVIYEGVERRLKHKKDSLEKVKAHLDKIKRSNPKYIADSIKLKNRTDSLGKIRVKHVNDSIAQATKLYKANLIKMQLAQKKLDKKNKKKKKAKQDTLKNKAVQ